MNKASIKIFLVFTLIVGAAGVLLVRTQTRFTLGKPGVLIGHRPVFGEKSNVVAQTSVLLFEQVPGFRVVHPPISDLELTILPPDTTYGRLYYIAPDHFNVQLNTIVMGKDRSSLHPPQYCITGQGWRITGEETISLPMQKPFPYDLKIQKLSAAINVRGKDGEWSEYHGYFLYWFVADGQLTPSRGERLWSMAREILTTGTVQRWAYVSYFSYGLPGQEAAMLDRMKGFIQQTLPQFQIPPGKESDMTQMAALK